MTSLAGDIRYALRVLNKSRGFTAVAVVTLALGIGANTAVFSMADAIMHRPFPFKDLDRIVSLWETIPKVSAEHYGVSSGNYFDWKEQNHVFTQITAYRSWHVTLAGPHEAEPVQAYRVLPSFFPLLNVPPLKGRFFSGGENTGEENQVVVSYGFWQERMGADPSVLGKVLSLNGLSYTIVGVMPKEFDFPMYAEIWVPWIAAPEERNDRGKHDLSVLARLKPGFSLSQARAEMDNLSVRLAREYPLANAERGVGVMLLRDSADEYARRFMVVVAVTVAFLLLLAVANVANLQLARGASRQKEMAIRAALGAGRGCLARQLLTEGIVLSLLAAELGLPLGVWGLDVIKANVPPLVARHISSVMFAQMDARMLAFTLAAAVLSGIAFTLPAAFQVAPQRIQETLKEGGRSSSVSGRRGMRAGLVVSEIAFAVVLLIGAGLMVKGFRTVAKMDEGFDPNNVITFDISLPVSKYPERAQVSNLFEEILRQLSTAPGIQSAAVASDLPALGDSRNSPVMVADQPLDSPGRPLLAEVRVISEDYFQVVAMPVRRGRAFAPQDRADSLPVAIISETSARRFWPRQDPLGRRLRLASPEFNTSWLTVVGIVGDVRHFMLDSEVRPTIYVPYRQQPLRSLNLMLRTKPSREPAAADLRAAVHGVDSTLPVYGINRISRFFVDLAGGVGVVAGLMATIAAVALSLSAAGIYAVMAYSVAQRVREFGIRLALGAQRKDIWGLVLGDSVRLLGIGLALGVPVALALGRVMSSVLSGIVEADPVMMAGFTLLLSAIAVLASYVPARRATKVDPIVALRNE